MIKQLYILFIISILASSSYAYGELCKNAQGRLCHSGTRGCDCSHPKNDKPGEKCKRADGQGFCSKGTEGCVCKRD